MNQGKRDSQIRDSGNFAFIALVIISLIVAILAGLCSCNTTSYSVPEEERIWINFSNGDKLELVADEYGNQYLRENAGTVYIYIPYPGETEEEDTLQFYQVKNK